MKMILRWFPYGDDSVSLKQIRQIPGVSGVATCFPNIEVGEVVPLDALLDLKSEIQSYKLDMEVIESINIHEDIKKGLPSKDYYIDNYIQSIKNLGEAGVKCLCYNFMPVMDWIRSDLNALQEDSSFAMSYRQNEVLKMYPKEISNKMKNKALGYSLPGWEPQRIKAMAKDIEFYQSITEEQYWKNMKYFLDAVIPYAQKYDIKMAIHPDDPPWKLFGLPKVITNINNIRTFLSLNPSSYNDLTFCTGSLGSDLNNNLSHIAKELSKQNRIHFVHLRNIKHSNKMDFDECAHLSSEGDFDMKDIVQNLIEGGFDGYIRPDHGRMIWGEKARPGYGLYDRALGTQYILGLWEATKSFVKRS